MTRALTALVALVLLVAPAAATAQEPLTNAPPGNSAIDEYLETIPGTTGDQVPRQPGSTGGGAGSKDGGSILTAAQRAKLERLGPDGKALADAVEATAPPREKPRATIDPGSGEGRSPISAVFDAATGQDGGGMGAALPIILIGSLLGVIALVLLRRRSLP